MSEELNKKPRTLDIEIPKENISKGVLYSSEFGLRREYVFVTIQIKENGIKVGEVKARKYLTPIIYYEFTSVKVEGKFRGTRDPVLMGYGSSIVTGINNFLIKNKAIGFLHNSLEWEDNQNKEEVFGLYLNKGWKYVDRDKKSGMGTMYFCGGEDSLSDFNKKMSQFRQR